MAVENPQFLDDLPLDFMVNFSLTKIFRDSRVIISKTTTGWGPPVMFVVYGAPSKYSYLMLFGYHTLHGYYQRKFRGRNFRVTDF
jgi:hypothetical protein